MRTVAHCFSLDLRNTQWKSTDHCLYPLCPEWSLSPPKFINAPEPRTSSGTIALLPSGAALLALSVDALLGVVEHGIAMRKRGRAIAALVVLAIGILAALAPAMPTGQKSVTVGAKGFGEQYIIARLIGHRLERAGYRVQYREGLGSAVVFGALAGGDIDVYVDYSGTIWTNEMKRSDVPPRAAIVREITTWSEKTHGINLLGSLGFENAYAFAMRGDEAKSLGIRSLSDLVAQAPALNFGSDLEFLERPEWAAVKRAYPLQFKSAQAYNPTFMYRAIESKRADVISAFSSDGRIAAQKLTVLSDPKGAIPGYDAILLVNRAHAKDDRFLNAVKPLVDHIPVELMREANYMVDRDADKRSPEEAATWLEARIGQ